MSYLPFEHPGELHHASFERFLRLRLSGAHYGTHVSVTCIEQNREIRVIDVLHHLQDLGGLVEHESGFELPNDLNAELPGDLGAFTPLLDDPVPRRFPIDARYLSIRWADRIDADGGCAEVKAKLEEAARP